MFRRTEVRVPAAGPPPSPRPGRRAPPNLTGDLDELLSTAPCFRTRLARLRPPPGRQLRGLGGVGARRRAGAQLDHLLGPLRRLLGRAGDLPPAAGARPRRASTSSPVSDRVREMLRLAADEAAAMVDAARRGGRPPRWPRRGWRPMRGCARRTRSRSWPPTTADEMLDQARRDRAEAAALLERARTEAAELVRQARDRAGPAHAAEADRGRAERLGGRAGGGGRPAAPAGRGAAVAAPADRPDRRGARRCATGTAPPDHTSLRRQPRGRRRAGVGVPVPSLTGRAAGRAAVPAPRGVRWQAVPQPRGRGRTGGNGGRRSRGRAGRRRDRGRSRRFQVRAGGAGLGRPRWPGGPTSTSTWSAPGR